MTHPQARIWERGKEQDPLETLEKKKTAVILAFQSPELGGHKHLFLAPPGVHGAVIEAAGNECEHKD